jgi:1-acyl-sn-glycerol-3-phosphate acyltransferase
MQAEKAILDEYLPRKTAGEGDLLRAGAGILNPVARAQIRFIQRSLHPGSLDTALRWCQRQIGARWINAALTNLRQIHGVERLPALGADKSFILVCNHRSFFDLYAVSAYLVSSGLQHRLLFPVRANFFYDNPLGPLVNGVMSFFAMYPPIFCQPSRGAFNLAGLDEVVRLLKAGGVVVGVHPEGTRGKDDDPYALLPAQAGVGRLIYHSRVPVIPVFINGLGNSISKQIAGNVTKRGTPVHIVFGAPVDFNGLLEPQASPRTYRSLSARALDAIHSLGQEEKRYRAGG